MARLVQATADKETYTGNLYTCLYWAQAKAASGQCKRVRVVVTRPQESGSRVVFDWVKV